MAERGCCRIVGRLKDTIIARRESLPRRDRRGLLPPTGRRRGGGRRPARRALGRGTSTYLSKHSRIAPLECCDVGRVDHELGADESDDNARGGDDVRCHVARDRSVDHRTGDGRSLRTLTRTESDTPRVNEAVYATVPIPPAV